MEENAQTRLRHILEASDAPLSEDKENFGKLKAAYEACLDESIISKRGSEPLEQVLAQLEEIYSLKGVSDRDVKNNLTDAVLHLIKFNVEALVVPSVSVRNPGWLFIAPSGLDFSDLQSLTTVIRILLPSLLFQQMKSDSLLGNTTITRILWPNILRLLRRSWETSFPVKRVSRMS